ncbi:MAG: permease-like cell division protein FtsX [Oscillospiraceae bacterium]|nr:permease-like cell division protein FtsX [Oscillospiraceae bacterium]
MSRQKRRRSHNFGYYIHEGFRGIFSHGFMSAAAIIIIAACLLITGSFSLVALNIEHNLDQLMAENEFLAYVDENLDEADARALEGSIAAVGNVAEVTFISREEAKETYLKDIQADDALYANLPDSVLRHRFSIRVDDISLLSDTISQVRQIGGIADISAALDVANGFVTLRNVVTIVAIGIVVVLLVISLFIVSNAIKLATLSREGEIAIMKMCGATNGFIRMPFVYEGVVLGLASALIAFACQWGLYALLIQAVETSTKMHLVAILPFEGLAPWVACIFGGVGLIVGVVGSLVTIRKYLRV